MLNIKECDCSIRVSERSIRVYQSFQHCQPALYDIASYKLFLVAKSNLSLKTLIPLISAVTSDYSKIIPKAILLF